MYNDNKDKYSDPDLIMFRNLYGKVAKLPIDDINVYVRPVNFGDWCELVRGTSLKVNGSGEIQYDIGDKLISQYIIPCVLKPIPLPEDIISKPVKINLIVQTVLNITDFDKVEVMLKKYTKALGRQQLLAMEMKRRLIATYGIEILPIIKEANIDDIMELLSMGEWISQNLGDFGRTLGVNDLIPMVRKGKGVVIDEKKLEVLLNQWLYEFEEPQTDTPQPVNIPEPPQKPPEPPKLPIQLDDSKLNNIMSKKPSPPPNVNVQESAAVLTISDVEKQSIEHKKKQMELAKNPDLNRIKEPKLYDANPENMSPLILERSKKEFAGNLVNMWNENQAALYEKIHSDAANPTKFKTLGDIQKEDDKSNVVLSEINNG